MLPSPTQPPPAQAPEQEKLPETLPIVAIQPEEEERQTRSSRRRAGETPLAHAVKAILRPVLKFCYVILSWVRNHRIVSLIALLLLLGSIFFTTYLTTGFPSTSYQTQKDLSSTSPQLSPAIASWLGALQNGDGTTMVNLQKSISTSTQQPDSAIYILQFSEKEGQMKWTSAHVDSIRTAADGAIDTFVEVSMTSTATSTSGAQLLTFWHFVTAPSGQILQIEFLSSRQVA